MSVVRATANYILVEKKTLHQRNARLEEFESRMTVTVTDIDR